MQKDGTLEHEQSSGDHLSVSMQERFNPQLYHQDVLVSLLVRFWSD